MMYVQYKRYREKGCHVGENKRQGVIKDRQKWYRYQRKKGKKMVCPIKGKA